MRTVICKTAAVRDERIIVNGIYVRSTVGLPELGETVVVRNPVTKIEFAATVIGVNAEERSYGIRVDLRRAI
jgi:hypothetical protein